MHTPIRRRRSVAALSVTSVILALAACGGAPPAPSGGADTPAAAPETPSARRDAIARTFPDVDRAFREFAERVHAPGITWGVIVDGALAHHGAVGVRDVATRAAIDQDTVFRIASMTKSVTAAAILRLRDDGRLSLDDPAERYVPELAGLTYPTIDSPKITIRHLLTHSAGFPEDNPWGDRQLAVTGARMSEMLRAGIPFSNPPGVAYEYSNYGFAILGRIVARASGMRYADYVKKTLLAPLGMTATTMEAAEVPADRLARGYRWEDEQWKDEPALPDGAFGPMGGMLTSSRDLTRWVSLLAGAWPARDDADTGPVRRASLREMQQAARTRPATVRAPAGGAVSLVAAGYGYGLRVQQTCQFAHVVSHTGGLPGYGSVMTWLPDYGLGIIAMSNLTYTSASALATDQLAAIVRAAGLRPRPAAPSAELYAAQQAVTSLINQWDDGLADRIAAENLFLDESKDRRRRAIEALSSQVGACRAEGAIEAENALRGSWTLACERGRLRATITLAPSMPPLVQHLAVESDDPARRPAGPCGS